MAINKQFSGTTQFKEISIDGHQGLMGTLIATPAGQGNKLVIGIPLGNTMLFITTNLIWPQDTHVSNLDINDVYRALSAVKIE